MTRQSILAALMILATGAAAAGDAVPSGNTVVPRESLQYFNLNPAIKMATVYGDMTTGAHGTFGQFPANFETPYHTHSGAYSAVVIKGVMTNPFQGESDHPQMQPGSFWHVPAGAVHSTACVSDTPCEFFFWADSAFDFTPTE